MHAVRMNLKDRKCSCFPDPLLRAGSVVGTTTPSRNDQDRKHVVVGDSNSNPFNQTPHLKNQGFLRPIMHQFNVPIYQQQPKRD